MNIEILNQKSLRKVSKEVLYMIR